MRKILPLFTAFVMCAVLALGQNRSISGQVRDSKGDPIPFATVRVKGHQAGVAADANGNFRIDVPPGATIVTSAAGFQTVETPVGDATVVTPTLQNESSMQEVVVTALGIRRTRNQLPYSAQQVAGEDLTKTRNSNFLGSLSGRVSGLEMRQTNTLGGSTNVVLRGNKSFTGNNQALFVVDGVPFDNTNTNTTDQRTGRGGYDYGNAAADINPDDIESITVLKGAAASALYGSRGSNGVILITTKKGKRGLGITINTGVTVGSVDKSTFTKYQKEYGGGYGPYYESPDGFFFYRDIDGDGVKDLVTPTSEDASYGGRFDRNLQVFQWDAFDPSSPYYNKSKPWLAAANDPTTYFEKPVSFNNSVFIDGGGDKGSFKLGYTRNDDKGILPNSSIHKDLVNFGSTYNITNRLTAGASVAFTKIRGLGRYGTGYDSKNPATNFRQWFQTNVDIKEQKDAYFRTYKNVTWNWADPTDLVPIYWDNVYWTRYENYQNDSRTRYFGNVNLNYKVTDWLNVMGRISVDSYKELQEERIAVGSVDPSQYQRFDRSFNETNYDLLANLDKDLNDKFNLKGLLGMNIRTERTNSISASTNGGLIVPKVYSLANSANPIVAPVEFDGRRQVNGLFAGATLSYMDFLTLDATIRRDQSSTLPKGNNIYYYPSISGGFVFSNLMKTTSWLNYGKLRANYAEVGNDAPIYSVNDVFVIGAPFGAAPLTSVSSTKNNQELKPERTKSWEIGTEMSFVRGRAGFDVTYYNAKTVDQILPVAVSNATGYTSKYVNSGTIVNKGWEVALYGIPVKTKDFSWNINLNWTRNRNEVLELFDKSNNLQLASFQGGVTLNATLGHPYGTIRGSNFIYTNGQRTVGEDGRYLRSVTSNEVIGNPNPDWIGGISNTFKYKQLSLSFLVDMRQGGQLFSLDLSYGMDTGLYPETAGLNDQGKPSRAPLADGGGVIMPGVTKDGKPNTVRVSNEASGTFGYETIPAAGFVYDASYVKLRELALTYSLPDRMITRMHPFKGIDISFIGRNLWLIHKNLPYADPEETISSGNLQGYQGGAYPTTRTVGVNLKFRF
jgi:TonB-linked SusC/RagA family outer membrane protein